MSLNYDLRDVQDNEHTTSEDGEKWGPRTETLIFATMAVDMGEITEKNHREFYRRFRQLHRVSAWGDAFSDITLEVVKAHIGLKTNFSTTTDAAWRKHLVEVLQDSVDSEIRREEEK